MLTVATMIMHKKKTTTMRDITLDVQWICSLIGIPIRTNHPEMNRRGRIMVAAAAVAAFSTALRCVLLVGADW